MGKDDRTKARASGRRSPFISTGSCRRRAGWAWPRWPVPVVSTRSPPTSSRRDRRGRGDRTRHAGSRSSRIAGKHPLPQNVVPAQAGAAIGACPAPSPGDPSLRWDDAWGKGGRTKRAQARPCGGRQGVMTSDLSACLEWPLSLSNRRSEGLFVSGDRCRVFDFAQPPPSSDGQISCHQALGAIDLQRLSKMFVIPAQAGIHCR